MLYILGGASRSGKSIVTHKLLKEKQIPFFSTDFLMMGFQKGMPEFGVHSENSCNEVAEKLWPVIKGMMTTLIEIEQDYLIEGDALLPHYIRDIISEKGQENIKACFVGYAHADAKEKLESIRKFRGPNDWTKDRTDEYILAFMQKQIAYSQRLEEECKQYNIKYFDTSSNFDEVTNQIFSFLA